MPISTKFSYADLELIPPDHNRYEIVDGELFVTPSPRTLHQIIVGNLHTDLMIYVRLNKVGKAFVAPLDVVFTSSTVLIPDIIFVSSDRLNVVGEKNISGAPDLVVEVISDSSRRLDREVKLKQYALYGVAEFWLIDPDGRTIEVFRLSNGVYELVSLLGWNDLLHSPLLPGFSVSVSSLWK